MSLRKNARQLLTSSCLLAITIGCSTNANQLRRGWSSLSQKPKANSTTIVAAKPEKAATKTALGDTKSEDWSRVKLVGLFDKKPKQIDSDSTAIELDGPNGKREAAVTEDPMELGDTMRESIEDEIDRDLNNTPIDSPTAEMIQSADNAAYRPRDANSLPSEFRILSESEMLSIALSHAPVLRSLGVRILDNPAAAATIYDSAISASDPFFGPDAALAEFDRNYSASVNAQNNDRVFNNATLGGQVQELMQDLVNINTGVRRRSMSGATWELNSLTGYDANNRAGNRFANYWETQLEAGVRQPLLQGAGKQFNQIAGPNARPGFNFSNGIIIARMNNRISEADFEIALRGYVRDLYTAYWDLVRHYHTYKSVLASRELAYETWQTIRAKAEAELEGGEANKEAQARAKYYSYRREVQVALGGESGRGGLFVAERQLRQLIGMPPVDNELLMPADSPVTARFVFDYDGVLARAMSGRTELRRQSIKVKQQQLRLIAAKNFMLPQLDLIGRYRLRGFGDDLAGGNSSTRFSSAQRDFFSLDHQEWEFGVEMGVVQGRRQARAAVRNSQFQLAREQAVLHEQQRVIRHEISDAHAEVSSAYYAMESSLQQVEASRQRLEASEALFEADKIQIEFLLDAQEELLRAEVQLATDQSRYSMSLVEINNTSGTLLRDIGIGLSHGRCGSQVNYLPTETFNTNQTEVLNRQSVVVPNVENTLPTPNYEEVQPQPLPETLKPLPNRPIEELDHAQIPTLHRAEIPKQLKAIPVARLQSQTPIRTASKRTPVSESQPLSLETPTVDAPTPQAKPQLLQTQRQLQTQQQVQTKQLMQRQHPRISPTVRPNELLSEEERSISQLFEKLNSFNAIPAKSR